MTPANNVLSIKVERDCYCPIRTAGVNHHYRVLLKVQHCAITPQNYYALVFVDDILTDTVHGRWLRRVKERSVFDLLVVRKVASQTRFLLNWVARGRLVSLALILTATGQPAKQLTLVKPSLVDTGRLTPGLRSARCISGAGLSPRRTYNPH